jgi:hypothetical protein
LREVLCSCPDWESDLRKLLRENQEKNSPAILGLDQDYHAGNLTFDKAIENAKIKTLLRIRKVLFSADDVVPGCTIHYEIS